MPHTTILFVHLQYDPPNSPQSRALRALAATVARPAAAPLYLQSVRFYAAIFSGLGLGSCTFCF
jgi:hypothetical protein